MSSDPLKRQRQEKFAQLCASGVPDHRAFSGAGYKPSRSNAARLRAKEHVAARIQHLQRDGAHGAAVTVEEVLEKLRAVYVGATDAGQFAAAKGAAELLGKTMAMFINAQADVPYAKVSDSKLVEMVVKELSKHKGGPGDG